MNAAAETAPEGKLRLTPRRRAILRALAGTDSHPDARWVYEQVQRAVPGISLATIYRGIQALRKASLVVELPQPTGATRYDANTAPHVHVTCLRCRRIVNLTLKMESLREEACRRAGFATVGGERLELFGLCRSCDGAGPRPETGGQ